ncbi:ATP phosphoribosyltransferase regulatory subunit [Alicyclobacillus herbarius]|uniref:ATP phosphoribosyltransferase regulatory subunit n=1 Tax=Alicyclobacillus herbarius TaxID=122960 RepID=UPI0023523B83|nr:ATP phosphoribosyltransferase regulatory subunit [Alicyclobacillus herbarius]
MALDTTRWAERPQGMRDLFPAQARLRRKLEDWLINFFENHGFALISSGAFEYAETLQRGRAPGAGEEWVQVFDRSGRPMALRPDMTPSVARMAAPLVAADQLPIRWCYAERVYHRSDAPATLSWMSGRAAESTQVGVEWIGESGVEIDSQLLGLCLEALSGLGRRGVRVVISHALLVPALLDLHGVPKERAAELLALLTAGDYVAFRRESNRFVEGVDLLDLLANLNPFQADSLEAALVPPLPSASRELLAAWQELCQLASAIHSTDLTSAMVFDLSLHRDPAYYTGMVFEVFAPGAGAPIAQGGRYDGLLKEFGADAPAVGFTFEVERLMTLFDGDTVVSERGLVSC